MFDLPIKYLDSAAKMSKSHGNAGIDLHFFDNYDRHFPFLRKGYRTSGYLLNESSFALENFTLWPGESVLLGTGVAIDLEHLKRHSYEDFAERLPELQYVGLIWPRSGLSVNHSIETGAGVIDESYRGEIRVKLYNFGEQPYTFNRGDRIAQLVIQEVNCPMSVDLLEVEELAVSNRGGKGYGSSGK